MLKPFSLHANHWLNFLLCLSISSFGINPPKVSAQPSNVSHNSTIQLDPASANWEAKDKYFLLVAASKTAGQNTDLPYAKVDVEEISAVLTPKGYKKLDTLTDTNATRENFIENLKRIRTLKENGLVVIYYSGHGAIDPEGRDLWLQLYGQRYFGESQGLSVSELVRIARGGSYKGELVIIIDACYSAQGAWTKSLSVSELENTLIFASSSRTEQSLAVDVSQKETMSAFTYYLMKGLTEDWDVVDENHDGIVLYEDLQTYIAKSLTELLIESKSADVNMAPEISGQQAKIWAAFDSTKAQNLTSLLRQHISLKSYWKAQIAKLAQPTPTQSLTLPSISAVARELARRVPPNADVYTKALQAIAQKRYSDALKLLETAEKTHVGELTDVYQARANAMIYQGRFIEGKKWYEEALRINRKANAELFEEAAMLFLMLSDFARAEALARQALEIREKAAKPNSDLAGDLFMLTMFQFLQGKFDEAELSIARIQGLDPNILDDEDPGLGLVPSLFLVLINLMKDKFADAESIAKKFIATAEAKLARNNPVRLMGLLFLSMLYSSNENRAEFRSVASKFIEEWEQAILDDNLEEVLFFIGSGVGFSTGGIRNLLAEFGDLAARLEMVCQRSLDLVRRKSDPLSPVLGAALGSLALAYSLQGKSTEAEPLFLEAIEVLDRSYGQVNIQSVLIQANLGMFYTDQRRYRAAEQAYSRSLSIAESTGSGLLILLGLGGLADLSEKQGKDDDAAKYYQRAISASQRIWPNGGAGSAFGVQNLARVYQRQRKYADAEKLYKRAVGSNEKTLGPQNNELVSLLLSLSSLYFVQERYRESESVLRRAFTIVESNKNAQVQDIAINLLWLSEVSLAQKQFERAKELFGRFLAVCEKVSTGRERDAVGAVLTRLGKDYADKNRDSDARRLYQQTLALYRNKEENVRSEVAVHLYDVARFLTLRGEHEEAEPLYKRTIDIDERALGKSNIEVAVDLEGLADLYSETNRYEEAIQLHVRAIEIREKFEKEVALGISLSRLGRFYIYLNRYYEAQSALIRARANLEGAGETNSSAFSGYLVSEAIVSYADRQAYDEAQRLLQRALSIDEQLPEKDPQYIAEDLRLLSDVYRFQQRYKEAERALEGARKVLERAFPKDHSAVRLVLFHSALLWNAEGRHKKAEQALNRALQLSHSISHLDQVSLVSWLERYASTMRFMKRNSEALMLETAVEEMRKNPREERAKQELGSYSRSNAPVWDEFPPTVGRLWFRRARSL